MESDTKLQFSTLCVIVMWGSVWRIHNKGEITLKRGRVTYYRNDQPIRYWFAFWMWCAFAALMTLGLLMGLEKRFDVLNRLNRFFS